MGQLSGVRRLTRNPLMIRFAYFGCRNRPFFHIVVIPQRKPRNATCIEQIGTYDPTVNKFGESLVAVNFSRLKYYVGAGAQFSKPVAELLGLSGFLPIHPRSVISAASRRKKEQEEAEKNASKDSAESEPSS
ncbi:probable 28S ribosomal protein S16, mitochondrial [Octopus vulgaris]|uniref:Small ribosomal subunit protein bS16m n=2 Tax=Octopus TaxID=6643 RepID=A0A6P7UA29_9MOLL|nr:probable 28S ribosomal protein S16, mitochondrial [Octopus sinensis]XP_036356250.1 probable 28S ribosomal protein S16, mitochondrial [Octopus sinensis]XP_036356251.1 probable 28S ribosomal protein S16, mitochondrial [Octopus sinensis]CAI9717388.1 probable 28S ribosomal protein S16, mitochondrial [Octopus vulgaris]